MTLSTEDPTASTQRARRPRTLKIRSVLHRFAAFAIGLMLFAVNAVAQLPETVELTQDEIARLGIEWTRAQPSSGRAILSVPAVAVVPPAQETIVSAPVGGLITRLLVAEDSEVDAGDPIVELRSLDLLAAQREYVDAASAARIAEAQLERDRMLHDEGIVARRRLDESEAQALAATLREEQAEQQLALVGADDAALEHLKSTGGISPDLTLRAPISGVVVERQGAIGQQVEPLEPIMKLANLEHLWLEARVPQERVHAVSLGMQLTVSANGETLSGEVISIGRTVDPGTQTVLVRAAIDNPRFVLRAGQLLQARIDAGKGESGTVTVPMSALARFNNQAFVFARTSSGVRPVPVTVVGEDGDGRAQLVAGELGASEEIAGRGVSALKALLTAD